MLYEETSDMSTTHPFNVNARLVSLDGATLYASATGKVRPHGFGREG